MRTALIIATALGLTIGTASAQRDFSGVEIKTTDLGGGIFMLEGAGGNMGVSVGEDGVFLIDDQFAPLSDKIVAAIAEISDKPVTYVLNTHYHGDHTGGNEAFGDAGAVVVAHDNVRMRMSEADFSKIFNRAREASPEGALPVLTFSDNVTLHFNGETASIVHVPTAHTDGDSLVFFENANVIHAGDTFFNGMYPFVDVEAGGTLAGTIAAMDLIIEAADEDTDIIAGHGPLADKATAIVYRDMLKEVRKRIKALVDEGKTLGEIVAADPLSDLTEIWGTNFIDGLRMTNLAYYSITGTKP